MQKMTGTVASNKMTKAVIVEVEQVKMDPKYHKRYKAKTRIAAACADSTKLPHGTKVDITSCRPVSKTISFKVVE